MALDERLHGKNGQVQMDPTGGSSLVTLADINSWGLDMSKDRADATCFGDTNKRKVVGLPDFSGTVGFVWNAAHIGTLMNTILGSVAPTLRLLPNALDTNTYLQGLAYLDGNITVGNNGTITGSSKFDAAGNWTFTNI